MHFEKLPSVSATLNNWSFEYEGRKYIVRDIIVDGKTIESRLYDSNMQSIGQETKLESELYNYLTLYFDPSKINK